jgi:hypothetical protein
MSAISENAPHYFHMPSIGMPTIGIPSIPSIGLPTFERLPFENPFAGARWQEYWGNLPHMPLPGFPHLPHIPGIPTLPNLSYIPQAPAWARNPFASGEGDRVPGALTSQTNGVNEAEVLSKDSMSPGSVGGEAAWIYGMDALKWRGAGSSSSKLDGESGVTSSSGTQLQNGVSSRVGGSAIPTQAPTHSGRSERESLLFSLWLPILTSELQLHFFAGNWDC